MKKLIFQNGTSSEIKIIKDGRKWLYFVALSNHCKYRANKNTGEIQIAPYWNTGKRMFLED